MRRATVWIFAVLLALSAAPAAFAAEGATAYACDHPGGREIDGRRFVLDESGSYGRPGETGSGTYSVQGLNVYFRGGALDGRQMLRLPSGRLRAGQNIFCSEIELPAPQAERSTPAEEPPEAPPEAKLIRIKPGTH